MNLFFQRIYKHTSLLNENSGKKIHKYTRLNDNQLKKKIIFILEISFLYFRATAVRAIISFTHVRVRKFVLFLFLFSSLLDLHF